MKKNIFSLAILCIVLISITGYMQEKEKISLNEESGADALTGVEMSREESEALAKQVKEDMKNNPDKVMYATPVDEPISNEKFIELLNKDVLTEQEARDLAKKIENDRKNNPEMVMYATEVEEKEF